MDGLLVHRIGVSDRTGTDDREVNTISNGGGTFFIIIRVYLDVVDEVKQMLSRITHEGDCCGRTVISI